MWRIGIDIGGTKTALSLVDESGKERMHREVPTPHGRYEDAVAQLVRLIDAAERELGERTRVGLGLPGLVHPAGGPVRHSFATPYNGHPLKEDLGSALGRDVRIGNDANCFALSEACGGAADGACLVFGAVLGTGAGGGLVHERRILAGANAGAGEWGHNPLPWMTDFEFPGPPCTCGRLGCIEQFVSGTALERDYAEATGRALDARAIATAARQGDARCEAALARLEDRLARALAHVINVVDPEVIVLGGGLSRLERLYTRVPDLWRAHAYSGAPRTRLVPAAHGPASGARGAAFLWP